MAMGPGVCLEYGGMTRYDPSKPRKSTQTRSDSGNGMVMLLLAIIAILVAFILSGKTVADLQGLL